MRLGIFLDLRNPQPWRRPWADHYRQQLDLIVEAERLGAGSVWITEHHRFDDGYLPQPLVLAAAIAARTNTIRIGTAIVLAPLRHPAHIAEEAAVADLVSGGRVEVGLGAGYSVEEYEMFGADLDRRFRTTDETYLEVRRLLDEDGVTPPPLQRPFPLWLGYQGPRNARRAGRLGAGLLTLNPEAYSNYLEGLTEGGHDPATARVGGVVDVIVADDPEAAWERVVPHYLHQLNTYRAISGGTPLTPEDLGNRSGVPKAGGKVSVRLAVVSVEEAIEQFELRTAGLPVVHAYSWGTVAGMPDDLSLRHIQLLLG
ncbi:MAG TPA: LLM class flavin-dependent oxidoreductase, partial [Acidimicrobiales bacterium]|nr:LLM class flavin-dependent oxidoreductase [Acidimicrobiales bacterium]